MIEVPKNEVLEYQINNISGSIKHDAKSKELLSATSVSGAIKVLQEDESIFVETVCGSVKIHAPFDDLRASSTSGYFEC